MIPTIDQYNNYGAMPAPMPRTTIQVNFDGLCQRVNPGGTTCYSFIIKNEKCTIYSEYRLAAHDSTNNVAEYTGLIKALGWLLANN